ncbi:MAG: CHAT domain-containing protein [Saprospiraceae bacterium]
MIKANPIASFFLIVCALAPQILFAQNPIPPPTNVVEARQLLTEAQTLFDSAKYQPAGERAELAYQFFKAKPNASTDLAEAEFLLGKALHKRDSFLLAKAVFEEACNTWTIIHPEGSLEEARTRVEWGVTLMCLDEAENSGEQGRKAAALLDKLKIENGPERIGALRVIARSLYGAGLYHKAIPYYEEALDLARTYFEEENPEMALVMLYLGNCYHYCGFLERAVAILERGLAIQQKNPSCDPEHLAGTYMALGGCEQSLKRYENALAYYEKAAEIRLKINSPRLAYAYSKTGQVYYENHNYAQALHFFQKESMVLIADSLEKDPAYAYNCRDFGLAYYGLKDFEKAIHWFERALAIFQGPNVAGNKGMGLDQCHVVFHIGRAQSAKGDYEAALQTFAENQKILELLIGPDYSLHFETNAEIANTYTKLYLKTDQDSFLEKSRAHFRFAVKSLEQLLQNQSYQGSEKKLLAEALPYFEQAIRTEQLFLKAHPDDVSALDKAWQFNEAMHAKLLQSAVQESNARHFAGIPDAELLRDSVLQSHITLLMKEREAFATKGRQLTDSLVLSINAMIYAKKEALKELRASFEKNYPDYFRLKYDLQTSSLAKTQQMLTAQQTLLEFFTGDSSIFVFVVQQNGSRMAEIKRDFPLSEWVQALREGISGYHAAPQKKHALYEKTVRQYADAAQKLYEKLLAPFAEFLTSEIIVVPGDGLANIPFEALLSATPKDLSNFNTYPFLLRSHSFQYAYSATMLHQMMDRQHRQPATGLLLAFAPFYKEDTARLAQPLQRYEADPLAFSPLPFSGEEVFKAKKRCGVSSEVLTGKEATKQKFLAMAAGYKILHLATHGKANHKAGDFSFLAFASSDKNAENDLLSVGELYNLPLNADLVLLSACETGIGEQQRGEGVITLARAFAFAGTKSIVASLWSVSDKSTMIVMDNFYAGIISGKPKNVALAEAKIQYLENNQAQKAHPYFWAGFVGVGDMSAIKN